MDQMVLKTQQWLNNTYRGKTGFGSVVEDGATGWDTIYGLIRALQIELGITATANNFGPGTQSRFRNRWPNGIAQSDGDSNVYAIIQGSLWCKGYLAEYGAITTRFTNSVAGSIRTLKSDIGLSDSSATIDLELMMALLSMKQFKLLSAYGGKNAIRSIQQTINRNYKAYTGILPTDGLYGREMNTGLIQVLQALEGFTPGQATGNFGDGTRSRLRTINSDDEGWVWLASAALVCNQHADAASTRWNATLASQVRDFQSEYALPVTGEVDPTTWMSLLTSKGDPNRKALGADCATILNSSQVSDLFKAGYCHVGRYLTGTYGAEEIPKAMNLEEIERITSAGLSIFPIYEDGGYRADYYSRPHQGTTDAVTAIRAARRLGFPEGTIIYFAVDFDAYGFQIDNLILPYFREISAVFNNGAENTKHYRVGIYAPRYVCQKVADAGYSVSSFVADMSTGFSGNLGYPIPRNWAFDQFHEYTLTSSPDFDVDKDAVSGKDRGVSTFDAVPKKTEDELIQENQETLIELGREVIVKAVLSPLNLWQKFVSTSWTYGKEVEIARFSSPDFDIITRVKVSETVTALAGSTTSFSVEVDHSGALTAGTQNAIGASTAEFDIPGAGNASQFTDQIRAIAGSVKSGNIAYGYALTATGAQVQIQATSENLVPDQPGFEARLSVTTSYEFILHKSGWEFRAPEVSPEVVGVAVGAIALIAVIVLAPEIPALAAAFSGLMDTLGGVGLVAAVV